MKPADTYLREPAAYVKAATLLPQIRRLHADVLAQAPPPAGDPEHEKFLQGCRDDFNAFMEYCFVDTVTRKPFVQGNIHKRWTRHIAGHSRAMIIAPREHGKTEQLAIGRPIWRVGNNPEMRYKIVTQSDATAVKRLTSIKGHILRNPHVREVFPKLRPHPQVDDWAKHTATVARLGEDKDPSFEAVGVLSSGTGGRADEILFDDVVDFRNAIVMPGLRALVKDTIRDVWLNLLTRDAVAVYIATPWHEDDATADMARNEAWAVLRQPIPANMEPVWPEMWSRERLLLRRKEIGLRAFARGFHLRAISEEDQLFKSIALCLRPDLNMNDVDPSWPRYTGVDVGHSKRKAGMKASRQEKPYTVIFTIALDPDKRRWPVSILRGHYSGPDTGRRVIEVNETHRPEVIMVEANAYQLTLLEWIRGVGGDAAIPLKPFTTGANKADEQIGLPGLAAEFDNQAWVIPTNGLEVDDLEDAWPTAWWAWYVEMRGYPGASLTDTVMACWFAREAVRLRGGPAVMVGSEDKAVQEAQQAQARENGQKRLPGLDPDAGEWDWRDYDGRGRRGGLIRR